MGAEMDVGKVQQSADIKTIWSASQTGNGHKELTDLRRTFYQDHTHPHTTRHTVTWDGRVEV